MNQSFETEILEIADRLRRYREVVLMQSESRFADMDNIDIQEIINLEQGKLSAVSVRTFLIYLDKMNLLSELNQLLDKDEDQLDQMADFIQGMEVKGHL